MKNLLLVIITLFSLNTYSQSKTTLPNFDSKDFVWKKGNDEYVKVKFTYTLEEKLDKEILDKVVMNIMVKSKYVLKNKYSFIPKELMIYKSGEKLKGFTKYVGKNGYGVEGIMKSYFEFDLEGNVTLNFSN
jgi:hypothetical protein